MTPDESSRFVPPGYPGVPSIAAAWLVLGTLAYLRHVLQNGTGGVGAYDLAAWLTCFVPWIALTPGVFWIERRFPLRWPVDLRHALVLVLAGIPIGSLATAAALVLTAMLEAAGASSSTLPTPWWRVPAREVLVQEALFACCVGAAALIRRFLELRDDERRANELSLEKAHLESSLHRAELELLRVRLNPHFLFNSLQNIAVLTHEDPSRASQMLAQLGDVLRVCLRRDAPAETTLDAEVGLAEAYAAVERVRFGDRLNVSFDIAPDARDALVPNLLLQPLIENALVHGLARQAGHGVVAVAGARDGADLIVTVTDNGTGPPPGGLSNAKLGIGLGATRERLDRLYPGRHALEMQPIADGGTRIRVVLPFRTRHAPSLA